MKKLIFDSTSPKNFFDLIFTSLRIRNGYYAPNWIFRFEMDISLRNGYFVIFESPKNSKPLEISIELQDIFDRKGKTRSPGIFDVNNERFELT